VLVLGEHPATYLSAVLLRQKTKLRVVHTTIPGEAEPDRLVIINPSFFTLHPLLEPLRRKLDLVSVYGLQFSPTTRPSAASTAASRRWRTWRRTARSAPR
jgi:hypothetical protein